MSTPESFSFSRRFRLVRKRDIDHVFRHATKRKARGPIVVLSVENELNHPRLGLAVAKRHVPKATDRSRVKRQIREWFRHRRNVLDDVDLIVRVRGPIDVARGVSPLLHCVDAEFLQPK